MDNLLDSQKIEAMINNRMKDIFQHNSSNKEIFNLLSEQQQEISQVILVDDPIYQNSHYYYPIKSGNITVLRRYGDFQLLSEYLFKNNPEIIQKSLPPKESGYNYLRSYVQENRQILNERKEKFQIYLNDIKKQLPKNDIFIKFLGEQEYFIQIMQNVDPQLILEQGYLQKIKKLYESSWLISHNKDEQLKEFWQLLQTKIMHLDQIQTFLVILYLNLQHKTKSSQVSLQNKEIQDLINNIIENEQLYQNDIIVNKIERLTKKISEIVELFPNVRQDKQQFESYDNLLEECNKLIKNILKEILQ
ncbi:unnamed protein product [Paramecium pentaurelia]|uniref:PX domain-containing protein n=1 Tax=Paramecium pentaurelia TaxID=43138 RepID=A0A8S1UCM6_9CILI|nr:unnamed protein product [Paramecium pentaurelia]CAD8162094.1 unnamed protein product [Paramecium pentaurelia]